MTEYGHECCNIFGIKNTTKWDLAYFKKWEQIGVDLDLVEEVFLITQKRNIPLSRAVRYADAVIMNLRRCAANAE